MSLQQAAMLTAKPESLHSSIAETVASDDRLLVARAQAGSRSAFGELYERHRTRIYHAAFRILRNAQDAEDAVQRSFQRAFTNLGKFRGDSAFATWMTRIAINEALMMLRQRRSETRVVQNSSDGEYESSAVDLTDEGPTPEEVLFANERRDIVSQAIACLRESLRTVVVLRELQGLTVRETARHLGLSVAAVKARVFHAKRCLHQHLERRLQVARNGFR